MTMIVEMEFMLFKYVGYFQVVFDWKILFASCMIFDKGCSGCRMTVLVNDQYRTGSVFLCNEALEYIEEGFENVSRLSDIYNKILKFLLHNIQS